MVGSKPRHMAERKRNRSPETEAPSKPKAGGLQALLRNLQKSGAGAASSAAFVEEDEVSDEEWIVATSRSELIPPSLNAQIKDAVEHLIASDPRIGFPAKLPGFAPNPHGWFYPAHRVVLGALLNDKTEYVIELGSWMGKSTRFICDTAPNAQVFAIDVWDNSFSSGDSHYVARENTELIAGDPLHQVFLVNCWEYREKLVPMRMRTIEGLRILKDAGIRPSVIYVDADHHYDPAFLDIKTCLELFPEASIVGDDWRYPDVKRAAKELASAHRKSIHVEGNTCWTYAAFDSRSTVRDLKEARSRYSDEAEEAGSQLGDLQLVFRSIMLDDPNSCEGLVRATRIALESTSHKRGHKRRTLLMLAARYNKLRCAKKLIELGANVQFRGSETALHIAVKHGHIEIARALLAVGASTTARNASGETPLEVATRARQEAAVALLSKIELGE